MPESLATRGLRRVVLGIYGVKNTVVEKKPLVTEPNNKPKNEADKRSLDFSTRNDNNKRLKRTLVDGTLQDELRNILQSLSNVTKYWLIYNAGDSCYILDMSGYNEAEWEQHTQGLVNNLVNLYSRPDGVALLEEDIHNIGHYDVEMYNTIDQLMDELLESEASIAKLAKSMQNNDNADKSYTDDDDKSTTSSSKLPPNINMEEEDDMDFTNENEPELRCSDNKNDTSPRTDSYEKKNDGGSKSIVKYSPADAMFDVSTFTNENDTPPTRSPPTDSVDLDDLGERDTSTKFAAQTCQIPTSSSYHSPSPKKATPVRSIVKNKNTNHTNPSQSTLLSNPTVQLNRVDILTSPLRLASSTTSSRGIFNNTTSNQLASLLNDTNHTNIDTDIESDVHHFTECNARDTITIDGIYGSVPIPTIFSNRELSKVIVEVPSIGDEDTLGLDIKHNHIFARAQIGSVSESSSLHTQISSKYNNNIILAIEYEKEMPPCKSSNCKTIIEQLNTARANGPVVVSLILARPFHNTLEGARSQLESKLKKENYNDADEVEQHDIDQAVEVISECLEHIYNHPTEFEQFFFKDPSQFTTLKDAEKKGKIGGVYIGVQQWHIYLKFGTSMSNCKNREELRKLLYTWLFCNDKEALAMIPPQFIDRLMALSNLPCMQFDPTQHLSKRYYFAIIIIEAILSSIHPTITNTVGDLVVQALPARLKAIADPSVSRELINEVRELGFGLPDDLIQFILSWPKLSDDIDWRRQHAKSIPSLAKYDLFNQHLKQPKECLKIFLYREIIGPMFYDFKNCVEISPRMVSLLKIVKQLEHIMTDDVLSQFQEDGTVDDSIAEKLYNILGPIMKFGEHYEEYESPSDEDVATGCVEALPKLLEYLPPNIIIFIETSIYKALRKHENAFFCSTFDESECKDVLPDDRLAFFRLNGENDGRRVIVGGTTFVAYSQDKGLPQIESSLQAQNALTKVLAGLGSIDADTARKILAKKKSYLAWLHFGNQDDNDNDECASPDEMDIASSSGDENADTLDESGSGRFYMSRRYHLPSDMCTGHIPSGLKCLLNILPVQYRTLIFLCTELEGLMFRLLLKALGGKIQIGPNTRLSIDANGTSTCGGLFAIGRFAASPCTTHDEALMCMFKAQKPTDPFFGHILCRRCSGTSYKRVNKITAEVEALGLDINRIIKLQSQISALQFSAQRFTSTIAEAMRCAGFLENDVNDVNLVSLLTQWVYTRVQISKLKWIEREETKKEEEVREENIVVPEYVMCKRLQKEARKQREKLEKELVRGTKSIDLRDESLLGIGLRKTQNGFVYFGDIKPDFQADRAGIMSGDVPLVNGKPIEYNTFRAMAANRPLVFDIKRYSHQQFYTKSSPAYIYPQKLSWFNVVELKEMLKTKRGFDDKTTVDKMKRPELVSTLSKMIEERLEV